MKHKRVLLFCGPVKAFVIFEFAPNPEDAKIELNALLADWMAGENLTLTDTCGRAVLAEATPDYLQELRIARAVKCGKRDADALTRDRLTMLYDNAAKYFPQDLDGLQTKGITK